MDGGTVVSCLYIREGTSAQLDGEVFYKTKRVVVKVLILKSEQTQ